MNDGLYGSEGISNDYGLSFIILAYRQCRDV